jgi:hypothetical protein
MLRSKATALACALLAAFAIIAAARSRDASAEPAAFNASGAVQVANTHNGSAILSGALGPGDSLSGTVAISNIGTASGPFTLGLSHLTDSPGPGGGYLSRQLDLTVEDITNALAPVTVYHGALSSLNPTSLGTFAEGALHVYRFEVSWPSGAADQTLAGSTMSVQFDWSAGDGSSTTTSPPSPTPPTSGGGTSSPPAQRPPVSTATPRFSLKLSGRQAVVKSGGVKGVAACTSGCTLAATGYVKVPGAAKTYRLVAVRKSAAAGKKLAFKLRLPRSARTPLRAALKTHRHPLAAITVSGTGAGGKVMRIKRKVRVSG